MKLPKFSGNLKKLKPPLIIRRVVGHSMVPTLPPGTFVVGVGNFYGLRPGHVVVVRHNGKEKIKRIEKIENNKIFVLGDHPDTSTDSRQFGWLAQEQVYARIVWPHTKPST